MVYSADFKKRAVNYRRRNHTLKEVEEAFGIGRQTLNNFKKWYDNGCKKPEKQTRTRKINEAKLRQVVKETPDAYLKEIAEKFDCTVQAVFYALKKYKITLKKDNYLRREI